MGGQIDIYMVDLNADTLNRLTNTAEAEFRPKFAPSGTQILYTVQRGANLRIDLMRLDDRSTREVMAQEGIDVGNAQWLLDETGFVYESTKRSTDDDNFHSQLHIYNLTDDEERTLVTHPTIFEYVISPDGQHIAYINNTFDNINPAMMCVIAISGQDDAWCISTIALQATPIIWQPMAEN
jgi:Tol biopolymer transport system component